MLSPRKFIKRLSEFVLDIRICREGKDPIVPLYDNLSIIWDLKNSSHYCFNIEIMFHSFIYFTSLLKILFGWWESLIPVYIFKLVSCPINKLVGINVFPPINLLKISVTYFSSMNTNSHHTDITTVFNYWSIVRKYIG